MTSYTSILASKQKQQPTRAKGRAYVFNVPGDLIGPLVDIDPDDYFYHSPENVGILSELFIRLVDEGFYPVQPKHGDIVEVQMASEGNGCTFFVVTEDDQLLVIDEAHDPNISEGGHVPKRFKFPDFPLHYWDHHMTSSTRIWPTDAIIDALVTIGVTMPDKYGYEHPAVLLDDDIIILSDVERVMIQGNTFDVHTYLGRFRDWIVFDTRDIEDVHTHHNPTAKTLFATLQHPEFSFIEAHVKFEHPVLEEEWVPSKELWDGIEDPLGRDLDYPVKLIRGIVDEILNQHNYSTKSAEPCSTWDVEFDGDIIRLKLSMEYETYEEWAGQSIEPVKEVSRMVSLYAGDSHLSNVRMILEAI